MPDGFLFTPLVSRSKAHNFILTQALTAPITSF
jgi:hypothetical protein